MPNTSRTLITFGLVWLTGTSGVLAQSSEGSSSVSPGSLSHTERVRQAIEDSPFDLTGSFSALTDYVSLRGFSQTDRGPALQTTIEASYNDFAVGFFASNVDFGTPEPTIEFDPYFAYRPTFGNFEFDSTNYYYFYLDDESLNYPEFFQTLSYTFDDVATVGGTFAWGPNYFGDDREDGFFYRANLEVPLPNDFSFSGTVGYQDFSEGLFIRHFVWDAGITYTFEDTFSFDVRYHDTDIDASENCVGISQCDATIVGRLTFNTGLKALRKMALSN